MKILVKFKQKIFDYVKNNFKEYMLVLLLFIIGVFIGVMIINNLEQTKIDEVKKYIEEFITKIKSVENISQIDLIIESIKSNIILAIILWIAGTTVIGLPVVLTVILARGVCLGYTIAIITYSLGTAKGILFCLITILLQNILFIPAILTIGVSSIRLYKSILKDRQKELIKSNIVKHTLIFGLMILVLIISSLVENTVSVHILKNFIKYF